MLAAAQASEGIDFRDDQARAVVLVGVPFPAARDLKVKLKKDFNDGRKRFGLGNTVLTTRPAAQSSSSAGGASSSSNGHAAASSGAPGAGPPPSAGVKAEPLSGEQWYELQAFRALNQVCDDGNRDGWRSVCRGASRATARSAPTLAQAVGRCIRHKHDWGAVILMDERFHRPRYREQLPAWVRGNVKVRAQY